MRINLRKAKYVLFLAIIVAGLIQVYQEVTVIPYVGSAIIRWPSLGLLIITLGVISAIALFFKD